MTLRRVTCLAIALGLCALPLLAMAAPAADQSRPYWRAPADRARLILAQDQTSCSCPATVCGNGTSPACSASCNAPKQAQCQCQAQCNEYDNPSGSNRCECVEE